MLPRDVDHSWIKEGFPHFIGKPGNQSEVSRLLSEYSAATSRDVRLISRRKCLELIGRMWIESGFGIDLVSSEQQAREHFQEEEFAVWDNFFHNFFAAWVEFHAAVYGLLPD